MWYIIHTTHDKCPSFSYWDIVLARFITCFLRLTKAHMDKYTHTCTHTSSWLHNRLQYYHLQENPPKHNSFSWATELAVHLKYLTDYFRRIVLDHTKTTYKFYSSDHMKILINTYKATASLLIEQKDDYTQVEWHKHPIHKMISCIIISSKTCNANLSFMFVTLT